MPSDYQPRLSINITEEQQQKISRFFPWGTQCKVFSVIIEDIISLCEKHGADIIIGAFIQRYIHLSDISKINLPNESLKNGDD